MKRPREKDEGDEEKLEREIRRLAEDGKRRRKEREEALRRDMQKEVKMSDGGAQTPGSRTPNANGAAPIQSAVSEIDRTVKVRWPVEGDGGSITADRVKTLLLKVRSDRECRPTQPKDASPWKEAEKAARRGLYDSIQISRWCSRCD